MKESSEDVVIVGVIDPFICSTVSEFCRSEANVWYLLREANRSLVIDVCQHGAGVAYVRRRSYETIFPSFQHEAVLKRSLVPWGGYQWKKLARW